MSADKTITCLYLLARLYNIIVSTSVFVSLLVYQALIAAANTSKVSNHVVS